MILSDRDIYAEVQKGNLIYGRFTKRQLGPASYDVCLGDTFRIFNNYDQPYIDVEDDEETTTLLKISASERFVIHPGDFVLAQTMETFLFPDYIAGRLEGRSSLGRLGLVVHSTAGFFDPGFHGIATLEMTNISRLPIMLTTGMRIAQMSFFRLSSPAENPYRGKYQGQSGPTESRISRDFEEEKEEGQAQEED